MIPPLETWIVGTRNLFVEGIIATLRQDFFDVQACFADSQELRRSARVPSNNDRLIEHITGQEITDAEVACDIKVVREIAPTSLIACITHADIAVSRICAMGANAALKGEVMPHELLNFLALSVRAHSSLSVMIQPKSDDLEKASPVASSARRGTDVVGDILTRAPRLSPREVEILICLAGGASNKVIARSFSISDATAKAHVRTIFRKLSVHSRTAAALFVHQSILPPSQVGLYEPSLRR